MHEVQLSFGASCRIGSPLGAGWAGDLACLWDCMADRADGTRRTLFAAVDCGHKADVSHSMLARVGLCSADSLSDGYFMRTLSRGCNTLSNSL